MNAQKIFETVAKHLFIQGHPAMDCMKSCVYRAPDKSKCAVGALIPDKLYNPQMEGNKVTILADTPSFRLPKWFKENVDLLYQLQQVHDDEFSEGFWDDEVCMREALRDVAGKHGLKTGFLSNLHFPPGEPTPMEKAQHGNPPKDCE